MKRLVALALTPEGEVRDEVAARLLEQLNRSQLKEFLAALQREMRRRQVHVTLAGKADAKVGTSLAKSYPGRELSVAQDAALGGGVRISAGDDIVDASMRGYIREIIEKLGGT
ncbi:MAG: F0F1 ATP synthase subunit delta [Spirochaetia bacterium]